MGSALHDSVVDRRETQLAGDSWIQHHYQHWLRLGFRHFLFTFEVGSDPPSHSSLFRLLFVRNLFSSDDGMTELTKELFNKAVADCLAHERVTSILGKPIKAFGELIIKIAVTIICFAQRIGQSAWSQRSHPSIPLYRASKQKEGSSYSVLSSRGKTVKMGTGGVPNNYFSCSSYLR